MNSLFVMKGDTNSLFRLLPTFRRVLLSALFVLIGASAFAHDIGVSKAELREREGNNYALSVQAGTTSTAGYPAPVLPDGFKFTSNPRGSQTGPWKVFEFVGDRALTAEDELHLEWPRDGIMLTAVWSDGTEARALLKKESGAISVSLAELKAGSGSWWAAAQRYLVLGVEHILIGVDHLLFVLCLLFVVKGLGKLIKTITAFTVAHSITLGLATFGYISLRSVPVEAAIALSIVFLASEIVRKERGTTSLTFDYPWLVAFAFGLLHGLGFAGALSEIGLAPQEVPIALLFFNVGVEIGQLLFVAAVLSTMVVARHILGPERQFTKARIVFVHVIGCVAMYWFLERSAGIFV